MENLPTHSVAIEVARTNVILESPLLTTLLGLYEQYGIQFWDSSCLSNPKRNVVTVQCFYECEDSKNTLKMICHTGPWKPMIVTNLKKAEIPFRETNEDQVEIECHPSWIYV